MRTAAAVALCLMLFATPSHGAFHLMKVTEVLTGFAGDPNFQLLELQMTSAGQIVVSGAKLTAFDSAGALLGSYTTPSNVSNGTSEAFILYGTSAVVGAGAAPDFVIPVLMAGAGGMVCWGKPNAGAEGNPDAYIDCVAYGGYSGTTAAGSGTPSPLSPNGGASSLTRTGTSGDNAADFELLAPMPCNNAGVCTMLEATTTTTTTMPPACGDADGNGSITATDALSALLTAVGAGSCAPSLCDVNSSGAITATDGLLILQAGVGQSVTLACPS